MILRNNKKINKLNYNNSKFNVKSPNKSNSIKFGGSGKSSPPNFVDESEINWLISCGYDRDQAVQTFLEKTHSPGKRDISIKKIFRRAAPIS